MAMGMTYDEYWYDEPIKARFYRDSHILRKRMENESMWIQGLYFYEALCDASPIFHDLAKPGTKAKPYPEQPHEFYKDPCKERVRIQNERKMETARSVFMAKMMAHNKRFSSASKEGSDNNGSHN